MRPEPTVYALCGFIGAGKTTFAKRLEQTTGAVRITKDAWLIRLTGNDPMIGGYADYDHRVCELRREIAFQLAGNGIDVIIDEGSWTKEQRDELRRRIEDSGAQAVFDLLDTPMETIRERVEQRDLIPSEDSFMITKELLDGYLRLWQPPGRDEDCFIVSDMVE